MKIENAVALVTGANRGIGLAFAHELLARGARKVYAAARDPAAAGAARGAVATRGAGAAGAAAPAADHRGAVAGREGDDATRKDQSGRRNGKSSHDHRLLAEARSTSAVVHAGARGKIPGRMLFGLWVAGARLRHQKKERGGDYRGAGSPVRASTRAAWGLAG